MDNSQLGDWKELRPQLFVFFDNFLKKIVSLCLLSHYLSYLNPNVVSCPTRLSSSWWWRPQKDSIEKRPDWEKTRLRKDPIEKRPDWEKTRLRKDPIEKRPDWEKTRLRKDPIEKRPDWEKTRLRKDPIEKPGHWVTQGLRPYRRTDQEEGSFSQDRQTKLIKTVIYKSMGSQDGPFSIWSFLNLVFSQSGLFSIGSFLNWIFFGSPPYAIFQ